MKTLIKLLIAAAIVNAAARYGLSAWTQYEFRDSVQQILLFGADASPMELADEIMREAEKQGVPLERQSLDVQRLRELATANASYVDQIELFPRYIHPKTWVVSVEVRHVNMGGAPRRRRLR